MSTSRETARDALVTLFTSALTGTGKPVLTVVGSKVVDLAGLTPLVKVLSGGTGRKTETFMGDIPTFYLEVQVWVLQEQETVADWTNEEAEDALDEVEALIAGVYESNRGTTNWEKLEYNGRSTVLEVTTGGRLYYLEKIPTIVKTAKS